MTNHPAKPLEFSIYFFAASSASVNEAADKYRLLREAVTFADRNGFTAVWLPERHFQDFGGLYPNPSVLGAAVAMLTKRLEIRAGSVVSPLQNPLRIAEEWSVVDNLSNGRVSVSFASGWHSDDFVLAPENYQARGAVMRKQISTVRDLWRGGRIKLRNGVGAEREIGILPRPIQPELRVWLTAQSDTTFTNAGELGFNVLTNFNRKNSSDLEGKIALYRAAMEKHHQRRGHFTLMAHTFIAEDERTIAAKARPALEEYLSSNMDMMNEDVTEEDRKFLIDRAVTQFIQESAFIVTVDSCEERARKLQALGVDEIACLIDFGIGCDDVIDGLRHIAKVFGLASRGS